MDSSSVLARIIGHRRVIALLSSATRRASLPPTLLFAGQSGVGKFVVARSLAQVINCLEPVSTDALPLDACGQCRSCDRIARGMHVDVTVLEPDDKASIKTDVVREMLDRVGYRPFEGRQRVVIIREADALELQAQNALLKSLEEPPPGTMFILTTAVPGALVPTVRSRCMAMRFGRLTVGEVAEILVRQCEMPEADAQEAAGLADGSAGSAIALASTDLAVLRELAFQLLRVAGQGGAIAMRLTAAATLATVKPKVDRSREEMALILRMAAAMLRDMELLNVGGDLAAITNMTHRDELARLSRSYTGSRARDAFGTVDRALAALERNAGTKVVADWVATQI
jgi:DNA polymerase-3 subunit delta'